MPRPGAPARPLPAQSGLSAATWRVASNSGLCLPTPPTPILTVLITDAFLGALNHFLVGVGLLGSPLALLTVANIHTALLFARPRFPSPVTVTDTVAALRAHGASPSEAGGTHPWLRVKRTLSEPILFYNHPEF